MVIDVGGTVYRPQLPPTGGIRYASFEVSKAKQRQGTMAFNYMHWARLGRECNGMARGRSNDGLALGSIGIAVSRW